MIDLYMEAKRREQARFDEANIRRMVKAARGGSAPMRVGLRDHFLNWFSRALMASGAKLQTQFK